MNVYTTDPEWGHDINLFILLINSDIELHIYRYLQLMKHTVGWSVAYSNIGTKEIHWSIAYWVSDRQHHPLTFFHDQLAYNGRVKKLHSNQHLNVLE